MSVDTFLLALNVQGISYKAAAVLNILAFRANEQYDCWPSIESIEHDTKMSRAGIFRALNELEQSGIVERKKRRYKSNIFHLNKEVMESLTSQIEMFQEETSHSDTSQVDTFQVDTPKVSSRDSKRLNLILQTSQVDTVKKKKEIEREVKDNSFAQSDCHRTTPTSEEPTQASTQETQNTANATQAMNDNDTKEPEQGNSSKKTRKKAKTDKQIEPLSKFWLPLESGERWFFTLEYVQTLQGLYPSVDLESEIRKMWAWLDANVNNRKTSRGIKRFVTNWLNRSVDSRRGSGSNRPKTAYEKRTEDIIDQINILDALHKETQFDKEFEELHAKGIL